MSNKFVKNRNSCDCMLNDDLKQNKDFKNIKHDHYSISSSKDEGEIIIDPDVEKISLDFYQKKFTDGLPIIPPTKKRVQKFYQYSPGDPQEILAILPPLRGKASREKIAINAVMAGCLPMFMPILEKTIIALSSEKFNLAAINATTHPVAVATIINGPVIKKLKFNNKTGCLGPGNLANATIGRAIRLCLINIAGAVPGIEDHATLGSPAKFTYCFAENEDESPWEPLHVERGNSPSSSSVTVLGMEAPLNVNDHRSLKASNLLDTIVYTASTPGCNNSHVPGELLVIMSPEHAHTIADEGWEKKDVKKYIHENAQVPVNLADRGGRKLDKKWFKKDMVPLTRKVKDVIVIVAGGPGRHSMVAPGFGNSSQSVTMGLD